jgi:hypothetical protein
MKKLLHTLLLLASTNSISAQVWVADNAVWHYD